MSKKRITDNPDIGLTLNLDLSTWPQVDTDALLPEHKDIFQKRKKAVELYVTNSEPVYRITELTGIHRKMVWRLVKRCFQLDKEGEIWGYRALIPYKTLKPYKRQIMLASTTKSNAQKFNGAFKQLLETYPRLADVIRDNYLEQKKRKVPEPVIKVKYIHKRFLDECRAIGLTMNDYPFNTVNLARRSVERYVKSLELTYFSKGASRYGEDAARLATTTGLGRQNSPLVENPYERVQFDGHRIDTMISLVFTTLEGDEIVEVIERIWLLTVIDVGTRAILGYHLSLNKEYTAEDVLQCIRNSIVPWKPKNLTIPGLHYNNSAGFPSGMIEGTEWGLWSELCYDNGKSNLSSIVKDRLETIVGCSVNAGPIKTPERRALIERFFKTFEEHGFHRLPSTTGSNPKDPRRQNPEDKAIKYQITFNHIEELTEVLLANYNGIPHEGISFLTPLEAIQQRIAKGTVIRQMPTEKRNETVFLSLRAQRIIKGNVKKGIRPYIQYENVIYRSDVLANTSDLIGVNLTLFVNIEDLRVVKAFLPDGSEFGLLTATGKWGVRSHSLALRKAIYSLKQKKLIHFTSNDDPIEIYSRYLESQLTSKKRARNQYISVQRINKCEKIISSKPRIEPMVKLPGKTDNGHKTKIERKLQKTIVY